MYKPRSFKNKQKTQLQILRNSLNLTQAEFSVKIFPSKSRSLAKRLIFELECRATHSKKDETLEEMSANLIKNFNLLPEKAAVIMEDLFPKINTNKTIITEGLNPDEVIGGTIRMKELVRLFNLADDRQLIARLKLAKLIDPKVVAISKTVFNKSDICKVLNVPSLDEEFIPIWEVSRRLNITPNRLVNFARAGYIPSYRINSTKGSPIFLRMSEIKSIFEMRLESDVRYIDAIASVRYLHNFFLKFVDAVELNAYLTLPVNNRRNASARNKEIILDFMLSGVSAEDLGIKYMRTASAMRLTIKQELEKYFLVFSEVSKQVKEVLSLTEEIKALKFENESLRKAKFVINATHNEHGVGDDPAEVLVSAVFSPRTSDAFRVRDIVTLGDLSKTNVIELKEISGFGDKRISNIQRILQLHNLSLKGYVDTGNQTSAERKLGRDLNERLLVVLEKLESKMK